MDGWMDGWMDGPRLYIVVLQIERPFAFNTCCPGGLTFEDLDIRGGDDESKHQQREARLLKHTTVKLVYPVRRTTTSRGDTSVTRVANSDWSVTRVPLLWIATPSEWCATERWGVTLA
eukprot:4185795-Pyramimonas_sp.AAC.1